jgi:hypothetical protein
VPAIAVLAIRHTHLALEALIEFYAEIEAPRDLGLIP